MVHVAGSEPEAVGLRGRLLSLQSCATNLIRDCSVGIYKTEEEFLLTSSNAERSHQVGMRCCNYYYILVFVLVL